MKPTTKESIDNFVEHGLRPGDFLMAVLSNDLMEAIYRADAQNQEDLIEICRYVYNEIPGNCWGNRTRVLDWMNTKLLERESKCASV
jgi:hypothetical protein